MTTLTPGSVLFDGVVKKFGAVTALKRLDLRIDPGQLVTLLGPSGCGKTTTLRLVAGLEMATEGKILIGGEDVTHLTATYRKVSMVFQSYALFPHMTVRQNVAYGLTVKSMPKAEAAQKAEHGLELVGLAGFGDRLPSELSGGQQQRVAVARAIVLEPEVLLLDEPLSNLDAKLRRHVREEIRQIQQRLGLTAVYVTHDQEEAMAVSDRIIVMKNAQIAQEGTPGDLYETPNSEFIADFIGDANLAACDIGSVTDGLASVQMEGMTYQVPAGDLGKGTAKMVLRPHHLRLLSADQPGVKGVISYAAYLGKEIQYTVDSPLGELFIISDVVDQPFGQGDAVSVQFDANLARLVAAQTMTSFEGNSELTQSDYHAGQSDIRPWGRWKVVEAAPNFTLKTIEVNPGQRLSLQYHNHRSEHWVVVAGKGIVTIGGDTLRVDTGSHVYVPRETKHRIENDGDEKLAFIEVQFGDRLEEADIVRVEDDYHR